MIVKMCRKVIIFTLLVLCLYEEGLGADEVFRCPDPFRPEEVNTLIYQVNTTAIKEAECELPTRRLTFSLIRNTSLSTVCNIAFDCSSPGPVSNPTPEKAECGCVRKSPEVWTFEVKLYVDKEKDAGAKLGFNVCSGPLYPLSQDIQQSCSSVSIGTDEHGQFIALVIGISFGVMVVVVIVAVIGYCCRSRNTACRPDN